MALTVENGTGVTGADTFITLAEFTTLAAGYFDTPAIAAEPPIRRAWFYMKSLTWRTAFPFPTLGGTIFADVKLAQAILAQYEAENPNGLQPSVVPGQQRILNRVGDIGWAVTGSSGTDSQRAVVTSAGDLLKPYIQTSGNFLLRA